MPLMVAWVGGLIDAADRRSAPSFWWLPLMALWANLHGGFVFGLVLIAPIALDAVVGADATARRALVLRWAAFALAALVASCCTPYGWNSLLAAQKILALGSALPLIMEWKPADFGSVGALEICLLLGIGLALWRGIKLPPLRIVLLLGLLHMALSQGRAGEVLALLAPLVLAAPLAGEIGRVEVFTRRAAGARRAVCRRRRAADGGNGRLCVGAPLRAASPQRAGRSRRRAEEAERGARLQRLRFRRLPDRERRCALHRRPHRTLWREILRRPQRRVRPDGAGQPVPAARTSTTSMRR